VYNQVDLFAALPVSVAAGQKPIEQLAPGLLGDVASGGRVTE
jgi:hypothetical protein